VAKELGALKEQHGKDISIVGSPTLIRTLLPQGLVDELSLLVHPIVVGSGKRLFADGPSVNLELVSATTIPNGVQHLVYRTAK
jgi:dihydrofolate reductase